MVNERTGNGKRKTINASENALGNAFGKFFGTCFEEGATPKLLQENPFEIR